MPIAVQCAPTQTRSTLKESFAVIIKEHISEHNVIRLLIVVGFDV